MQDQNSLTQLLPIIIFMILMLGMFWWLIITPTKKRQKRHQEMVNSVQEGEEIVTVGGIHGRVTRVRDKEIELEVAQGVRLRIDRRAIRRRAGDEDAG